MKPMFRQFLIATVTAGALLAGHAVASEPRQAPRDARDARDTRELRDSVRRVERDTGGSVLRAERVHGRDVNRVKVLTPEGRVRVVHDEQQRSREAPERGPRRERRGRDD
ncbi:MAG: hypothetical protein ACXIUZ_15045 [Lysobacteraceae bacterium]|jgi:Spy/CpxP family protein refolding chaperone